MLPRHTHISVRLGKAAGARLGQVQAGPLSLLYSPAVGGGLLTPVLDVAPPPNPKLELAAFSELSHDILAVPLHSPPPPPPTPAFQLHAAVCHSRSTSALSTPLYRWGN